MGQARVASVSIDLDEIGCYSAIHGLRPVEGAAAHAIYDRAVPRFEALFEELRIRATFFAIGADLTYPGARAALRRLAAAGHEIGSHSLDHWYDLTRRDAPSQRHQVVGSLDRIEAMVGERPVGFRAPGYTITRSLFDVLQQAGLRYDSSVFPCPAYFGAKAAAIGAYGLRARFGSTRPSNSIIDDPRVLLAPADPYRIEPNAYWKRGEGMMELPIGVTRGARLPYIGTSLVLAGRRGAELLTRGMVGRPLVNLELHGIDLADADVDGLEALRTHQPDLRKSAIAKEGALRAALQQLTKSGYHFVPLREAADLFAR